MAGDWETVPLGELYDFSVRALQAKVRIRVRAWVLSFKDVLDNYFVPRNLSSWRTRRKRHRESCSMKRGDVFARQGRVRPMEELGIELCRVAEL